MVAVDSFLPFTTFNSSTYRFFIFYLRRRRSSALVTVPTEDLCCYLFLQSLPPLLLLLIEIIESRVRFLPSCAGQARGVPLLAGFWESRSLYILIFMYLFSTLRGDFVLVGYVLFWNLYVQWITFLFLVVCFRSSTC